MKNQISKIIENWLTFMDMEKENKLRIDKGIKGKSKIKNEQYINYSQISKNAFLDIKLTHQQYNIFINISKYFKYLTLSPEEQKSFLKNDEIDDKMYFSCLLLSSKYEDYNAKTSRYFYPIFAIPLKAFILNGQGLTIDSVNDINDYIVFKNFLIDKLLIDEDNILDGENIIEFLSKLVNENLRDKNFLESIEIVSRWIENRLSEIDSHFIIHKTANFPDFLISQLDAEDYLKLIYDDLKDKKNNNYKALDKVVKHPLACSYLFDKPLETFNIAQEKIYKGAFGKYPLALGQAIVMQHVQEGKLLTAVQGAPGTGKTTLLLSMIANRITKRALSIIEDKDFDNLMLITSTSNKAVDNVSDAFSKDFSQYSWLYFIWGNGDKKNHSFNRLQETIKQLKDTENIYDKSYTDDISMKITNISENIDDSLKSYEVLKQKIDDIKQNIKEIENDIKTIEEKALIKTNKVDHLNKFVKKEYLKLLENTTYKNSLFFDKFDNDINNLNHIFLDEEILEKIAFYEQNEVRLKKLSNEFNIDEIKENMELFNKLYYKTNAIIETINESSFLIWLKNIFGRKKTIIKNFIVSNKDIVERCFIDFEFDNLDSILRIGGKIEYFNANISKITVTLDDCIAFNMNNKLFKAFGINYNKTIDEIKSLNKEVESLEINLKQYKENLINKKRLLKKSLSLFNENYQDGFLAYFKKEYHNKNVKLFELSLQYVWQTILKNKETIIKSLEEWQHTMNTFAKDDRKSEFMKNLDFHKKNISLVYPVMTTTIASSMSLFFSSKPNIYDYLIVDEAGMITPNLLFPLISRSKKSIIVGDPKQLEPIVTLSDEEKEIYKEEKWSYIEKSKDDKYIEYQKYSPTMSTSYHRAARCQSVEFDDIGDGVILDEHRRCLHDIAQIFIGIAKYDKLKIETDNLKPDDEHYLPYMNFGNKSLYSFNIQLDQMNDNTNLKEIDEINKVLDSLENAGFNLKKDIGIITPYKNQSSKLISRFKKRINHTRQLEKIGTVHKFQGAEFPVVLFSSVVGTNDSIKFINSKANMLNVAVSRAKYIFIVIGNIKVLKKGTYSSKII
jgi:superfamily I DNA and/or RNA helicase